mgnify:CR=1 FL=1
MFAHCSDQGWIEAIVGGMFSGKSEELIRRVVRAKYAKQKVLIFKHSLDSRFDKEKIVSHRGNQILAVPVKSVQDIKYLIDKDMTRDVKLIAIDEVQFFDDRIIDLVENLANQGKRVVIAGLDQDFLKTSRDLPFTEIEKQAYKIHKWGKNVFVKIPVTNSKGKFSGKIIKKLSNQKLKLNITAVYTLDQVKKIIKCVNKKSDTIISIFAGRMADAGKDPVPIIKNSVNAAKKFKKIKILWASTREAYNYTEAIKCNCQIITMPPKIIYQISQFGKSFKVLTNDTVKKFYKDAVEAKFKL